MDLSGLVLIAGKPQGVVVRRVIFPAHPARLAAEGIEIKTAPGADILRQERVEIVGDLVDGAEVVPSSPIGLEEIIQVLLKRMAVSVVLDRGQVNRTEIVVDHGDLHRL